MGSRQLLRLATGVVVTFTLMALLVETCIPSAWADDGCSEVQIDTGTCRAEGLIGGNGDSADLIGLRDGNAADPSRDEPQSWVPSDNTAEHLASPAIG